MKPLTFILFFISLKALPLTAQPIFDCEEKLTALIIGISNYANIIDLKYADRDAELLAVFFSSLVASDCVEIRTLINQNASLGKITNELLSLMTDTSILKSGDRVILYLSGHGDVESRTVANYAYFLPYDCPVDNYMAGGLNLKYVEDFIATLIKRKIEVFVIIDACRSGQLIKNHLYSKAISQNFIGYMMENSVIFLSCKPDELSLEGEKWGGGRGLFSYVFLEGLKGFANENHDTVITVMELERYLEDQVPLYAKPYSQTPLTITLDKDKVMVKIKKLQKLKSEEMPSGIIKDVPINNFERPLQQKLPLDSTLIIKFRKALQEGRLITPKANNAYYYLQILKTDSLLSESLPFLKRTLSTAIIDSSQQFFNLLLAHEYSGLSDSLFTYQINLLDVALELVSSGHFLKNRLFSNRYFFEGTRILLNAQSSNNLSMLQEAVAAFNKSIEYDSSAAHAFVFQGICYKEMGDYIKALESIENALAINTNYAHAHHEKAVILFQNERIPEALTAAQRANGLRPEQKTYLETLDNIKIAYAQIEGNEITTIDSPGYDGYQVGQNMVVQGMAQVMPEYFVWVFARPSSFEPLWYPQGQVSIDASDNSWYKMVYFGEIQDIGTTFDIAVAVFNEKEHLLLQKYWEDAMSKGDWKPIKMPATVAAPALRQVMKARH